MRRWLLLLMFVAIQAAEAPWTASWIGPAGGAGRDAWICYRTTIDGGAAPTRAEARIACDSKYWLWLNGRMVVFEGGLKRGPTPQDTYYDRVDLGPHLRPGRNTLAILVRHFGKPGFSHNPSGKAGLVFEADLSGRRVASGSAWKARLHPAYGDTGRPHPNYRLPEGNIRFDARLDPGPWYGPDFDDGAWPAAVELGVPPCAPWNRLEERPIPLWRDAGLKDYVNAADLPAVSDGRPILCRLPADLQVTPWLEVEAPAGKVLDLRTDTYQVGGTPSVRAEYVSREGRQAYESLGWMSGNAVIYAIPAGIRILGLKYRETGYDADLVGRFTCDDPALDALWAKARRTLYVTMRDTYMDCPDRERGQWWGDEVNELGEAFYVFDALRGPRLARKGILELARWRRPDHALYAPVPAGLPADPARREDPGSGVWQAELPQQMLASVGWYGFWLYHWYSGDRDTIAAVYPAVRAYLDLWGQGPDGQAVHRPGDWDWADWGEDIDVPVLESAWLYLALKGAAAMAPVAGHPQDAAGYEARMHVLAAGFDRAFWREGRYRSGKHRGRDDDRGNALAVVAGLAAPEHYPDLRRMLGAQEHASPYLEKYVLEALCRLGAPGEALARMKKRYAEQIRSPLTTLWENWGEPGKGPVQGSINHGWSGGPLTILSQWIAGLAPAGPGWSSVTIAPRPGPLDHIEAVAPTPAGPVSMVWDRKGGRASIQVALPGGIPGTLVLPAPRGAALTVNGKPLPAPGVVFEDTVEPTLHLPGGTWTVAWE